MTGWQILALHPFPDWAQLLAAQKAAMEQQKQEMGELRSLVMHLGQIVNHLSPEQQETPPITAPVPEGIKCLIGFVVQCELFFRYQPRLPNHAKVIFVISWLTGKARTWGATLVTDASPLMNNYAFYSRAQGWE
uniref:DUF4939 domain-containing protein n=1 Tax=Electrophorus electricus TaxID=8005 RepID=A0AAY5EFF2_ELEEL